MARGRKSVTIRDVAEEAGVSLQTVSRVINDGPNVRPVMREKVQAAIDRPGYVPSLAAQRKPTCDIPVSGVCPRRALVRYASQ